MKPKGTILVTGGGGYIGSHTVLELLKNNYFVVVVDNLSNCYAEANDKPESLKKAEKLTRSFVRFYKVDIRNADDLDKVFKNHEIDAVMHFAALKAVGESVTIPLTYYQNNLTGSTVLMEVMRRNNVKKFVFSSSATVYGVPQFLPITEDHPTGQNITNPYGKAKYFVEEILKDLCASDPEWKVVLLRYFNPVGADESGEIGEDPSGIPNNLMPYLAQVSVGRIDKLKVFGDDYPTRDGTGIRDYIHITDLTIGHVKALEKLSKPSLRSWKAYNLGTGQGCSVLELIDTFSIAAKRKIKYEIVARRAGDIASCFADASLARVELNWVSRRGIKEMCEDTWNWQSNNPNGFQKA